MGLQLDGTLLLAGAGKMGGALLDGWLAGGADPKQIIIQDPSPAPEIQGLIDQHGITVKSGPEAWATAPAVMVMAVKPQIMDDVFEPLAAIAGPETLVISIAAGCTIQSFEAHLAEGTGVIRVMPNTPAAIGQGISVCVANRHASEAQRALAGQLMAAVGDVAWLENEDDMDAVTAVSGSGPAYVFLLAECLAEAGVKAGLEKDLAAELARATVAGAGALLKQSTLDAAQLRKNVTSPGGTTEAALRVLMKSDGLRPLMREAVAAASQRGRELR